MALSQADFYAYSRATGAPIPEDPMERAQMAPEVLAFRRNQLKAPEKQGADPLSVGLGVGLALAGGVGAVLGARRLMGGRKLAANSGVRQANLSEMAGAESPVRRVVAETQPEPSKTVTAPNALAQLEDIEYESPYRKGPTYQELYPSRFEYPRISPETIQTRRQAAAQSAAAAREAIPATYQLELGGEVSPTLRQIRSSEFGPNISPVRRDFLGLVQEEAPSRPLSIAPQQLNIFNPRSYLEQKGSLAPIEDLTSVQQQSLPQVIDQKFNAVESGEDQMTGRIKQQLQRNEDLDLNQIGVLEETANQLPSISQRLRSVGAGLSGAPEELGGDGIKIYSEQFNRDLDFSSPITQKLLASANVTQDEAVNYWVKKLTSSSEQDYETIPISSKASFNKPNSFIEKDEVINQIASRLPDGLPVDQVETARPLSSQELADIAKSQMIAARQELEAKGLRPGTQRFDRALAQTWTTKSMSGVQPGTSEFRRLQELGKVDISLPETIRKAVEVVGVKPESEAPLPERTLINIGPEAEIETTAAGTAIRGAVPSLQEALPKLEQRQLMGTGDPLVRNIPLEMGQDIPGALRTRGAMSADIPSEELSKQEIVYQSLNRPATPEVPGGSAGIGVYGIEPSYVPGAMSKVSGEYSAAASRKPTYVPGWLQKKELSSGFESLTTPQLIAGAEAAKAPSIKQSFETELQRRETAKKTIVASEVLRRARIEGRDPQDFLRRQLGI